MKNIFKVILILVLVGGAIAGTCFVFFKNYKEVFVPKTDLTDVVYDVSKEKFNTGLDEVNVLMNENETDARLNAVISTYKELDEIWLSLISYYAESDFSLQDKNFNAKFNTVISTRSLINSMVSEYKIKSQSTWFNRVLGANDLFETSANYLVEYSKLIKELNLLLDANANINKSVDVKFSMINLYADVVTDIFSKVEADENSVKFIKNFKNLDKLNAYYEMENSQIVNGKVYTNDALQFIENYSKCDQTTFAKNFAANMEANTTLTAESTVLQKAFYFYKQIYGLGG